MNSKLCWIEVVGKYFDSDSSFLNVHHCAVVTTSALLVCVRYLHWSATNYSRPPCGEDRPKILVAKLSGGRFHFDSGMPM